MTRSKEEKYDRDDIRLARFAKALSHPARIVIIRYLALVHNSSFSEISKELPIADSTVSQHLHELKSAGLIGDSYEPPKIRYSINNENWRQARKILKGFVKMKISKSENSG